MFINLTRQECNSPHKTLQHTRSECTQPFHGYTKLQLAVYTSGEDISSDILHVWQWIIM